MHDCEIYVGVFIIFFSHIKYHILSHSLFLLTHKHRLTDAYFFFTYSYLKSPHIPRVSRCLQTILVAFQEKLQEEPAKVKWGHMFVHQQLRNHIKESGDYLPRNTLILIIFQTCLVDGVCRYTMRAHPHDYNADINPSCLV